MIRIRNLNKTYYGGSPLHVLKGIDMDVEKGEFLSIMGASGSGKSTLLNILGILDSYDTGEYLLDDILIKDLSETKAAELRNHKIGFIFQSFNLISFKNAMENVALPLYYQGISRKKRNILAMEYLDKMGLKTHAEHLPNELSGGQKQRVAIARALIAQPKIILADEPTGALDSKTSKEMMQILREVNAVDGVAMIIVTHEKEVAEATDRIIHIKDGIISNDEELKYRKDATLPLVESPIVVNTQESDSSVILNEDFEQEVVFEEKESANINIDVPSTDMSSDVDNIKEDILPIEIEGINEELVVEEIEAESIPLVEEETLLETKPESVDKFDIFLKTEEEIEIRHVINTSEESNEVQEEIIAVEPVKDISLEINKEPENNEKKYLDTTNNTANIIEEITEPLELKKEEKESSSREEKSSRGYNPNRKWQYI